MLVQITRLVDPELWRQQQNDYHVERLKTLEKRKSTNKF